MATQTDGRFGRGAQHQRGAVMIGYPAIDIRNGKCVRLLQGSFDKETVYSDDPVAMAKQLVKKGASWLHIVDLDGARTGVAGNLPLIEKSVAKSGVRIELGGGIRHPRGVWLSVWPAGWRAAVLVRGGR